ncbi:hypothetical protein ACPCTO_13515 [Streptomyces olivoreticuli]
MRTALRHRLFPYLHPRRFRNGQLAEQRHQFLDPDPRPVKESVPEAAAAAARRRRVS